MVIAPWPDSRTTLSGAHVELPIDSTRGDAEVVNAVAPASRAVYRYSVIPGGAHNRPELVNAIARDAVVAAHYRTVSLRRVHEDTLATERHAYVSYRIGDRVYWTTHKVTLPAGERILTDGVTEIRARCGNCISDVPQSPTSNDEPDPVDFDALAIASPDVLAGTTTRLVPAPDRAVATREAFKTVRPLSPSSIGPSTRRGSPTTATDSAPTASADSRLLRSLVPGLVMTNPVGSGHAADGVITNPLIGGLIPGELVPGTPNAAVVPPGLIVPGGGVISGGPVVGGSEPGNPGAGGPDRSGVNPGGTANTLMPPAPGRADFGINDSTASAPDQPPPIPEPTTVLLVGTGAVGALWRRVRSRRLRRSAGSDPSTAQSHPERSRGPDKIRPT
jgi:hypothetical protein